MRSSAIRLDSFVAGAGYIGAPSGTAGLEAAFQRGLEQGLNDGRELSLDALTSALAELHGGSLKIRSTEGSGTIVSVRIPSHEMKMAA